MTKTEKQQERENNRKTRTEIIKNMVPAERQALKLLQENPEQSLYQLGKKLKQLGYVKSDRYLYTRLKISEYLSGEISRIRQANFEMMSREVVPEALKIHKRVLKDKKIDDLKKKDWVAMAERAEFHTDEGKRPVIPQKINIEQMQVLVQQQVDGSQVDGNKAIDDRK